MKSDNQQGKIEKNKSRKRRRLTLEAITTGFCRQICELGKEGKERKGRRNGDRSYPSSSGSSSRSRGAEQHKFLPLKLAVFLSTFLSVCLSLQGGVGR